MREVAILMIYRDAVWRHHERKPESSHRKSLDQASSGHRLMPKGSHTCLEQQFLPFIHGACTGLTHSLAQMLPGSGSRSGFDITRTRVASANFEERDSDDNESAIRPVCHIMLTHIVLGVHLLRASTNSNWRLLLCMY